MAESHLSDRFALPFLASGQAQKEITHNEALMMIDMLLHIRVEEMGRNIPPDTPIAGQCWIIAAGGAGIWEGLENGLACYTSGGWRFIVPQPGMQISSKDDGRFWIYDGNVWAHCPAQPDGLYIAGKRVVGERSAPIPNPVGGDVVDNEARATLAQIVSILEGHGLIGAI